MTDFIIDLMVIIWLTILVYLFLSELYFKRIRFKAIKRINTFLDEAKKVYNESNNDRLYIFK